MTAALRLVEPRHENRSVPVRPPNAALRTREYLTAKEVEKLIATARSRARYGLRDATLILVAFRHGLRASEICDLEWSQVEWGRNATLHVRRAKNGKPAAHPIHGDELRALREFHRQYPDSGYVFTTERGGPFHAGCRQSAHQADRRARRISLHGPLPHAQARLRLRARQCRPRYASIAGLARPSLYPAHGAI
jgi:integrase